MTSTTDMSSSSSASCSSASSSSSFSQGAEESELSESSRLMGSALLPRSDVRVGFSSLADFFDCLGVNAPFSLGAATFLGLILSSISSLLSFSDFFADLSSASSALLHPNPAGCRFATILVSSERPRSNATKSCAPTSREPSHALAASRKSLIVSIRSPWPSVSDLFFSQCPTSSRSLRSGLYPSLRSPGAVTAKRFRQYAVKILSSRRRGSPRLRSGTPCSR